VRGVTAGTLREPAKERSAERVTRWPGPVCPARDTESCRRRRPGDLSSRDDVPPSPCPLRPSVRQWGLWSSGLYEEPHSIRPQVRAVWILSRLRSPAMSADDHVPSFRRLTVHSREDQGIWSHGARMCGDPAALGLPGPCRRRSVLATGVHAARQSLRDVPTRLQCVTARVSFELTATSNPGTTDGYLDGLVRTRRRLASATRPGASSPRCGGDVASMLSTDGRRLCVGSHLTRQGAGRR